MSFSAHDNLALIHAVFGSILALFIVPSAILVARFRSHHALTRISTTVTRPRHRFNWLKIHMSLNLSALLLMVVVFALGVMSVKTQDEGYQFTLASGGDTHHMLGLAMFVLVIVQAVLGYWAHRTPHAASATTSSEAQAQEEPLATTSSDAVIDPEVGRGCCSGSNPNVEGGCECSMSNLNGRPCCCAGRGDEVNDDAEKAGKRSKKKRTARKTRHPLRVVHWLLGLGVAGGLYAEVWNGMNVEWPSMAISETVTPQSVQYLFWIFFLVAVGIYAASIGSDALAAMGRRLQRTSEEDAIWRAAMKDQGGTLNAEKSYRD